MTRYSYRLTQNERTELEAIKNGRTLGRTVLSAQAILLMDKSELNPRPGLTIKDVSEVVGLSERTLASLREKTALDGPMAALNRKERDVTTRPRKFGGDIEARIIQIACTDPPAGRNRWTIQLIRDELVELKIVDSISLMSIHRALKKTNLNLTSANTGKSPQSTTPTS